MKKLFTNLMVVLALIICGSTYVVAQSTWYGSSDVYLTFKGTEYPYTMSYSVVYNADKTLTVTNVWDFEGLNLSGLSPARYAYFNGTETAMTQNEDGSYSVTSTATFEVDVEVSIGFKIMFEGGDDIEYFTYKVGASSEPVVETPKPTVTAKATNVTETSADIVYSVALPEELAGATVAVTINGEAVEYKAGEENTYSVTNLTANTNYDYVIVATATLDGVEYPSKETKVSFKTLSNFVGNGNTFNGSAESTYKGELDGVAFEDAVTINYNVTWNTDATLTFVVTPSVTRVGLVPQINYGTGFKNLVATGNENEYAYTTTETYEENTSVNCEILLACAGGAASTSFTYVVGSASEPVNPEVVSVAIANPKVDATNISATVYFDVTVSEAALGKTVVVYKDGVEAYNFTAEETTTLVELSYSELDPQKDFTYTYVAKVGDTESEPCEITFSTLGSAPAEFTVSGYVNETVWAPTFTGNVSTGRKNTLLFEVTLPSLPTGFGGLQVFEVTETGNSLIATLNAAETTALADEYVYVGETTKEYTIGDYVVFYFYVPYEAGQYAQTGNLGYTVGGNTVTGINGIEMEEGEAVYYNFQGVRVANPEKGMFIRVQNGKAEKVIL